MKAKITALAGMLALSLMTSVTFAQKPPTGEPADKYELSAEQDVQPVYGVIRKCEIGTLNKNVNSGISNANSAGNNTLTLDAEGVQLNLYIAWELDNTFLFYFVDDQGVRNDSGVVYQFGVKNNTDDIIYRYGENGVSSDTELNDINVEVAGDIDADRANNVDICVAPLDLDPPAITFDSPLDGEQVSGTDYPVQVTVYDPSGVVYDPLGLDEDTVTFNIDGDSFPMTCEETDQSESGTEYICSYSWNTEEYDTGFYDLTATATDLVGNTGTEPEPPIEVEVVRLFIQCFGTIGTEDFNDILESELPGGCDPTGAVLIQTPPNGSVCDVGPGEPIPDICYIAGTLLKPANPTALCGIYGFADPRMQGGSVPILGGPLHVFDTASGGPGLDPNQAPDVVAAIKAAYPDGTQFPSDEQLLYDAVVLDENTFCANGCCLIAQHTKGALLDELYLNWDAENGTVFIKVHKAREQFAKEGKADLATTCYNDSGYNDSDLQKSFNAGYEPLFQTDDDTGVLTVLTQECQNPARTLSRGNGFDVSNIIVNDATIPDDATPTVWLEFRLQKIQEDFDRVLFLFGLIDRDGLLLTGNFNRDVQNPVKEAQRKFQSNNIASKDQAIVALMEAADGIRTKTTYRITEANPPGEALALIEHLIYELGVTRDEQATIQ